VKSLPEHSTPRVTLEQLKAFSESARDPNPIHLSEQAALESGLPGVIAHGMLVASYLCEYAEKIREQNFGEKYRLSRFQVRFKGMTVLGESLVLRGSTQEQDGASCTLLLEAVGQDGEIRSTATAVLQAKVS
jgi:acyl dehydratase